MRAIHIDFQRCMNCGRCDDLPEKYQRIRLPGQSIMVLSGDWHRIYNETFNGFCTHNAIKWPEVELL